MMAREPLQVALVGLGYFSQFHLRAWQRIEGVDLAAVADRDRTKTDAAAQEYRTLGFAGLSAMLETIEPDILDIVTPPPTHATFIRQALKTGRLIICQKPFCENFDEAQAVTAEAEAAGVQLVVHENFRFQPWHREIKRRLDNGLLGTVYQCRFSLRPGDGRGRDAYLDRQPTFQQMPRFLVRETGVHFLDLFGWLFGNIVSVYSDLRQLNPVVAGEDAGILLLQHATGVRSIFDANRLSDHAAANRRKTMGEMLIEGEVGALRLDGEGRLFFRPFGQNREDELPFDYEDRDFGGGCVEALNRHVVGHIREGHPLENRAADYLRVVALEQAAYRSAETGRLVRKLL